jgi:hypothetical protein
MNLLGDFPSELVDKSIAVTIAAEPMKKTGSCPRYPVDGRLSQDRLEFPAALHLPT